VNPGKEVNEEDSLVVNSSIKYLSAFVLAERMTT
jgi:hypothetical protein